MTIPAIDERLYRAITFAPGDLLVLHENTPLETAAEIEGLLRQSGKEVPVIIAPDPHGSFSVLPRPDPGAVVVFRGDVGNDFVQALQQATASVGWERVTLVVLPTDAFIEEIPEKEMNRRGWFRNSFHLAKNKH